MDSQSPENKNRILFADDDADMSYLQGWILQQAGLCAFLGEKRIIKSLIRIFF